MLEKSIVEDVEESILSQGELSKQAIPRGMGAG